MAEVIMPKMSEAMTEGRVLGWRKHPGDPVARGEVIAEIETDKVNVEIEAESSGTLAEILVGEGGTAAVGAPIARIEAGADAAARSPRAPDASGTASAPAAAAQARGDGRSPQEPRHDQKPPQPRQEQKLPEPRQEEKPPEPRHTQEPAAARATERTESAERAEDRPAAARDGERIKASPIARRLAAEHGVDLSEVRGSGPGGRIVERDLEPYLGQEDAGGEGRVTPAAPSTPAQAPAPSARPPARPAAAGEPGAAGTGRAADAEEQALSPMRQAAARAVVQSMRSIPHFYVTAEADMAAALDLRAQLKAAEAEVSVNDLILKAAALALRGHPDLNAQFLEPDRVRRFRRVHLGIMVAVPGGLVAPVLRDADRLSLVALAQEARRLIERARARQLRAEELQGATFSVSNLGQFPVTQFAAIIHPPEAGILAVGRIQERARVRDGALAARPVLAMTVAADHRITDGAGAAAFLAGVQHLLEHPILLSMT